MMIVYTKLVMVAVCMCNQYTTLWSFIAVMKYACASMCSKLFRPISCKRSRHCSNILNCIAVSPSFETSPRPRKIYITLH